LHETGDRLYGEEGMRESASYRYRNRFLIPDADEQRLVEDGRPDDPGFDADPLCPAPPVVVRSSHWSFTSSIPAFSSSFFNRHWYAIPSLLFSLFTSFTLFPDPDFDPD
jgi:hypothetical protein